jgi:hypothetical protein
MDAIKCSACGHDADTEHGKMGCDHVNDNGEYDCFCELSGREVKQSAEIARLREALKELVDVLDYAHNNVKPRGEVGRFLFGRQNETFEHGAIKSARKLLQETKP